MPTEEVSFAINIPLLSALLAIAALILGALYQLRSAKQDRRRDEEKKEERANLDREKMATTITTTMQENLKHTIEHFDDRINLIMKDIKENEEEIVSLKKGLEKLTYEVLEIIKVGSAGAKARLDAIEQRVKSIEEKLKG